MQVVELLRELILGGEFEPGERLVEAPLCQRFGVSRTVVREAIRQLETEGLVTILANRGPVVSKLTPADARALYEVRGALEGLAGALFAQRAGEHQRAQLRTALAVVSSAYEQADPQARLAAKDAFYDVLLDGADNSIIRSTLRGIHARVQLLRGLSMQAPGRAGESLSELAAIVAAVERWDPEGARLACEGHVKEAAVTALGMLSQVDFSESATS